MSGVQCKGRKIIHETVKTSCNSAKAKEGEGYGKKIVDFLN